MKVKSASPSPSITTDIKHSNVFEITDVESVTNPVDLIDVEIISAPSTENSSGRLDVSVASIGENLVAQGFDKIELVVDETIAEKTPDKASPELIDALFQKKDDSSKVDRTASINVDLTANIDKKKLPLLTSDSVVAIEENEDVELVFAKSSNFEIDKPKIDDTVVFARSEQSDNSSVLELRLGKNNETFEDKRITPTEQLGEFATRTSFENNDFNVERTFSNQDLDIHNEPALISVLKSSDKNEGNKRTPTLTTRESLKTSSIVGSVAPQKPLIKSIERKRKPSVKSEKVSLDMPGPKGGLVAKITNRDTGKVYVKPIRPRRIPTIPLKETIAFKSDKNLPKINVSYLNDSQTLVSITGISENIQSLKVLRREISQRTFEDSYELVNAIENPPDSYSFIDSVENARAFKYICIPDDLPIYSFQVYRNKGFKFENIQEPFSFAYQEGQNVRILINRLPQFIKKLFIFRKSSAEDEEILVDSVALFGRGRRRLRLIDDPPPIEQIIDYRIVGIDENGIENTFEERPRVIYTSRLGREAGNILKMEANYNQETGVVEIKGEAEIDNVFISSDDGELKNPSQKTLDAAARGQNLIKIQIRRINLKTEDDEIILKEIINPGLSKFESELISLNRLKFAFEDSGDNAATFGYTPLLDNTSYVYIGRIIVYPIGVELRKISDFESIEGIRGPGRLRYNFDPAIFDHPSNVELGILPAGANEKEYQTADIIGQTSRSIVRRVKVIQSDISDSVSVETSVLIDSAFDPVVKLEVSVPKNLVDDLDHAVIELSYDTVRNKDVVDRIYFENEKATYYDYSFDDLACNTVGYTVIGISKDFNTLFKSSTAKVSLKDPQIKLANERRKSFPNRRDILRAEEQKSKRNTRNSLDKDRRRVGRNG